MARHPGTAVRELTQRHRHRPRRAGAPAALRLRGFAPGPVRLRGFSGGLSGGVRRRRVARAVPRAPRVALRAWPGARRGGRPPGSRGRPRVPRAARRACGAASACGDGGERPPDGGVPPCRITPHSNTSTGGHAWHPSLRPPSGLLLSRGAERPARGQYPVTVTLLTIDAKYTQSVKMGHQAPLWTHLPARFRGGGKAFAGERGPERVVTDRHPQVTVRYDTFHRLPPSLAPRGTNSGGLVDGAGRMV